MLCFGGSIGSWPRLSHPCPFSPLSLSLALLGARQLLHPCSGWYLVPPTCNTIILPLSLSRDARRAQYLSNFGIGSILKVGLSERIPPIFVSHIALATSNSVLSDSISREHEKWPLLLLSHGLKGVPEIYTTFGEQMASLGFIVIAPAHTDGSCSESYVSYPTDPSWEVRHAQLNQRVSDMRLVLDTLQMSSDRLIVHLASHINFQTVGICGHSFGGATAAQMLQKDARISSGVSWDGWMYPLATPSSPSSSHSPLYSHHSVREKTDPNDDIQVPRPANTKPFLFINSDGFHWEENLCHMRQWCAQNSSGGHIVTIKGTNHHNFNDLPFLGHRSLIRWVAKNSKGWFGDTDPEQATRISVSLAAAFFTKIFQTDTPPTPLLLRSTLRECLIEHTSKALVDYVPPANEWKARQATE